MRSCVSSSRARCVLALRSSCFVASFAFDEHASPRVLDASRSTAMPGAQPRRHGSPAAFAQEIRRCQAFFPASAKLSSHAVATHAPRSAPSRLRAGCSAAETSRIVEELGEIEQRADDLAARSPPGVARASVRAARAGRGLDRVGDRGAPSVDAPPRALRNASGDWLPRALSSPANEVERAPRAGRRRSCAIARTSGSSSSARSLATHCDARRASRGRRGVNVSSSASSIRYSSMPARLRDRVLHARRRPCRARARRGRVPFGSVATCASSARLAARLARGARRLASRRVAVEEEDDVRREAPEELRLLGGERGAERRDDVRRCPRAWSDTTSKLPSTRTAASSLADRVPRLVEAEEDVRPSCRSGSRAS